MSIDHGDGLSDKLTCGADDRPGRERNRADVGLSHFAQKWEKESAARVGTSGVNELYVI